MILKSKMFILLAIVMPVVFGAWLVFAMRSVDKSVSNHTLNIDYEQGVDALDVYRSESKTNVVFTSKEYSNVRFRRKYSGLITRFFIIPSDIKKKKPEKVNVWFDKSKADKLLLNTTLTYNICPFIGIQEGEDVQKGRWYYFDIYCYLKEKYLFLMLLYFMAFIFVAATALDHIKSESPIFPLLMILIALCLLLFMFF